MQVIKYPEKSNWKEILQRPVTDTLVLEKIVSAVLNEVRIKGDEAVKKYTLQFDKAVLEEWTVTDAEFRDAAGMLSEELKAAIQQAKNNIEKFHAAQQETGKPVETMPGV